ncbi:hypothetical protein SAMD00019534_056220 [Acytostelium subglobosum LB1]|uniref:hypothetical protein n=1 Tax=Acytostelium subglobosum LB1 TaxID=1410327 RepID=UPI000644DFF2|nr:hypothetical protein SAMD00019534_056220 [Acytostelium subglobosum LB1]GAM22447.1 hypothetical protein SAMD00019534_056220 [Acytostelium subglobosum LB1]|eukprot:XP_012754567.1 hypothetical protein SAMD00019534_056220 [Acytostelium subglobosum LB1]
MGVVDNIKADNKALNKSYDSFAYQLLLSDIYYYPCRLFIAPLSTPSLCTLDNLYTVQTPVHNVPDHGNTFIYRIDAANFRPSPHIEQSVFKGTRLQPEKDPLTKCHGTLLSVKPALHIKFAKKCFVRVRVYGQYAKSDSYKMNVQYEKPKEDDMILSGTMSQQERITPKGVVVDTILEVLNTTSFMPQFIDNDSVVCGYLLEKQSNVSEIFLTLSIERKREGESSDSMVFLCDIRKEISEYCLDCMKYVCLEYTSCCLYCGQPWKYYHPYRGLSDCEIYQNCVHCGFLDNAPCYGDRKPEHICDSDLCIMNKGKNPEFVQRCLKAWSLFEEQYAEHKRLHNVARQQKLIKEDTEQAESFMAQTSLTAVLLKQTPTQVLKLLLAQINKVAASNRTYNFDAIQRYINMNT